MPAPSLHLTPRASKLPMTSSPACLWRVGRTTHAAKAAAQRPSMLLAPAPAHGHITSHKAGQAARPRPTLATAATVRSGPDPATQTYVLGTEESTVPLGGIQKLPEPAQAAFVAAYYSALALGTWALTTQTDMGWALSPWVPFVNGFLCVRETWGSGPQEHRVSCL